MSGATLAWNGKRRFLIFPIALLLCLHLTFSRGYWALFDDAGARSGREITPCLKFGHDGPNTALLESFVGPIEPCWKYQCPLSPSARDGNERVQSRNIIRHEYLPEILNMLPDDAARRTVIRALTDPENRLRVHQSFILMCLHDLQFPPGMNGRTWWQHHEKIFKSEHDPFAAASLTQDWLETIDGIYIGREIPRGIAVQRRAVAYQQRGAWGGHVDFGYAFMEIETGDRKADKLSRDLADSIAWWPER